MTTTIEWLPDLIWGTVLVWSVW